MAHNQAREITPTPFLLISLSGLCLLILIAVYPPKVVENFTLRKPLVGSILAVECLLGILAVFYPKRCSRVLDASAENRLTSNQNSRPRIRGHHPDCKNYSTHISQVGNRYFCAGCAGLFSGAVATLAGTILYFFGNLPLAPSLPIFLLGCAGVALGLLQFHLFNLQSSSLRLLLNAFFVFGTFLALIGLDAIAQNIFADLFLISLSFFWLYTRISLSRQDHRNTCRSCDADSCEYDLQNTK
jgi:hypothetical protein